MSDCGCEDEFISQMVGDDDDVNGGIGVSVRIGENREWISFSTRFVSPLKMTATGVLRGTVVLVVIGIKVVVVILLAGGGGGGILTYSIDQYMSH